VVEEKREEKEREEELVLAKNLIFGREERGKKGKKMTPTLHTFSSSIISRQIGKGEKGEGDVNQGGETITEKGGKKGKKKENRALNCINFVTASHPSEEKGRKNRGRGKVAMEKEKRRKETRNFFVFHFSLPTIDETIG